MDKRTFLAVAISLAVLFLWQMSVSKLHPIDKKEVTANKPLEGLTQPQFVSTPQPVQQEESELGIFETLKSRFSFTNPGARLKSVHFQDYNLDFNISGGLYEKGFLDKIYTLQKYNGKLETAYLGQNGHSTVHKFKFPDDSYRIDVEIVYKNSNQAVWTFPNKLVLITMPTKAESQETQLFEVFLLTQNEQVRKNPLHIKDKFIASEPYASLGFRNRYACLIIKPNSNQPSGLAYIERLNDHIEVGLDLDMVTVPANGEVTYGYTLYCGPQDSNLLKKLGLGFEEAVYFGRFDFISQALLSILRFFHRLSHSWGLAIILLSVFVFLILYPLTWKQLHSMKQMQGLQPQIEALRKAHKDNPQKLNKEIMELYKKHRVNPLGGCLPMLLQIPIFFGLYQALSRSIELKGAPFLWIKDLAEPDRLFQFSNPIPLIGKYFNLLPVLMALAMFFQQKLSMKAGVTASGTSTAEQQQMMLILFPVLFGIIFYNFPSGLSMYWFMNTLLSTISQWKISKIKTSGLAL